MVCFRVDTATRSIATSRIEDPKGVVGNWKGLICENEKAVTFDVCYCSLDMLT